MRETRAAERSSGDVSLPPRSHPVLQSVVAQRSRQIPGTMSKCAFTRVTTTRTVSARSACDATRMARCAAATGSASRRRRRTHGFPRSCARRTLGRRRVALVRGLERAAALATDEHSLVKLSDSFVRTFGLRITPMSCPTAFCACKPAELTLTVLRKTRHHVMQFSACAWLDQERARGFSADELHSFRPYEAQRAHTRKHPSEGGHRRGDSGNVIPLIFFSSAQPPAV